MSEDIEGEGPATSGRREIPTGRSGELPLPAMAITSFGRGEESENVDVIEIDIPSRFDLVTVVRMIIASCSTAADALVGDRLDDLRWVTSEATTNAIQANQVDAPAGRVTISAVVGEGWVRLSVVDQGPGMPEEKPVPDISEPERLDIEGGFGIPLMRTLSSSEVIFDSSPVGTAVHLELWQGTEDPVPETVRESIDHG